MHRIIRKCIPGICLNFTAHLRRVTDERYNKSIKDGKDNPRPGNKVKKDNRLKIKVGVKSHLMLHVTFRPY